MSGAVGKPATLGGIGGGLGISKEGEPELRIVGAKGKPTAEGGLPMALELVQRIGMEMVAEMRQSHPPGRRWCALTAKQETPTSASLWH